jgi:hypothetical protein
MATLSKEVAKFSVNWWEGQLPVLATKFRVSNLAPCADGYGRKIGSDPYDVENSGIEYVATLSLWQLGAMPYGSATLLRIDWAAPSNVLHGASR